MEPDETHDEGRDEGGNDPVPPDCEDCDGLECGVNCVVFLQPSGVADEAARLCTECLGIRLTDLLETHHTVTVKRPDPGVFHVTTEGTR